MDFNTGSGPERPASSGGSGQGPGGPSPRMSGGETSGDFNLGDPVQSFIQTTRGVLLSPGAFFRSILRQGNFVAPLVYAVICSVIAGILTGFVGSMVGLINGTLGVGGAIGTLLGNIVITPIVTVIGLFVGAGIYHLLVLLLVKPNSGFEATFRVVAYSSALQLVTWIAGIPILGAVIALLALVYGLYVACFGIQEIHSTTRQRAAVVVAIPVLVGIVLAVVFGVLIAALIAAALSR